jgi:hypothetical protein
MSATLFVRPTTLRQANTIIEKWHRHHKPVRGMRFAIKLVDESGEIHGVAICGRPKARMTDQENMLEVDRLCTNGSDNACSQLYGACARIAKEMGFDSIQTFILASEPGISLRASGWDQVATSSGGQWTRPSRPRQQTLIPEEKQKWQKVFRR